SEEQDERTERTERRIRAVRRYGGTAVERQGGRWRLAVTPVPPYRHTALPPMRQREQIRQQPERPRDAGRKLTEEAQSGVDVGSLPRSGDEKATRERRVTRIVGFENRSIRGVPAAREVQASFL